MSGVDVTTSFARTLADEWVRNGVTTAVVSPGSRNTPLTLALLRDGRFEVDVVLDERSAGFRGLGVGLATGRPAIVCCTSGTAAVNLHPAVVEAFHAQVPMLVCTADRPPELRDWGAGQTVDQAGLFGGATRWYHDPGPAEPGPDANARWRALACRAVAQARSPLAGPVHLNLPFREPLVPTGGELLDAPGRDDGAPWVRATSARRTIEPREIERLAGLVRAHSRGLVVAGSGAGVSPATAERFSRATGWPIMADPLSQLRSGDYAVAAYEAMLRCDPFAIAHRPEIVLRIGAPLTSKVANAWLRPVPAVLVEPAAAWRDPDRTAAEIVDADADPLLAGVARAIPSPASASWSDDWRRADARARHALDAVFDGPVACEGRIARDVAGAIPDGGSLVVASSLPVRALEWAMAPRSGLRVLANRGANGIDGFVSTTVGVARASAGPVVALCGDLCLLHDTNGLLGARAIPPLTVVVVDNRGGGIFSYLPQSELPEFEVAFATPQPVDLLGVVRAHGWNAEPTDVDDVPKRVAEEPEAPRVLVVRVDRDAARDQHGRAWAAVAAALG